MSYDASLYAALHRGTDGDVRFYTDQVRGVRRVLELGCGYGRILTQIARDGAQITGLDNDTDMLALAKNATMSLDDEARSRITLILGDMRDFSLGERFDRIIIPFNGLYCLLSQEAVVDCLRCVARHLNEEATLVFDAYVIDDFHSHADPQQANVADDEFVDTLDWQGRRYDVYEHCDWRREEQRLQVRYRHVPRDGGPTVTGTVAHRYLLTWQVDNLCREAGLLVEALCEDFAGKPLTHDAQHMVCIARRG